METFFKKKHRTHPAIKKSDSDSKDKQLSIEYLETSLIKQLKELAFKYEVSDVYVDAFLKQVPQPDRGHMYGRAAKAQLTFTLLSKVSSEMEQLFNDDLRDDYKSLLDIDKLLKMALLIVCDKQQPKLLDKSSILSILNDARIYETIAHKYSELLNSQEQNQSYVLPYI